MGDILNYRLVRLINKLHPSHCVHVAGLKYRRNEKQYLVFVEPSTEKSLDCGRNWVTMQKLHVFQNFNMISYNEVV